MRLQTLAAIFTLSALIPLSAHAERAQTSAGPVQLDAVVSGLDEPWGFGFLPGGGLLITERDGRLLHIRSDGTSGSVSGLPEIEVGGQGGLLDVMIPADFQRSREVFLSFSIPQGRGAGTGLAVGRLTSDGSRLETTRVIFESEAGSRGGRHFGSRIVEGRDGKIYLTIGDRGDDESAQNLANQNGTVVRLNRDGSVPSDNPFLGQEGAQPEIWSYGHRNPQGAALDLNGNLWVVEHGARGGDEVNRVQKGANYGWPTISYGRHYSGLKIGEGTEKAGMEQPEHYWDPSIAPSGMMIYSGAMWPEWRGDVFVGSLKFGYLSRLDGGSFAEEEIEADATARTRDVREGPDGAIWFLSVGNGALYRMTPGDGA
ncbi:MAG: PQQ-dependent sugar dehydrogenase [Pseudomonadota bacterium]